MVWLDNYTWKDLRDKSEHIAEEKSKSIKESKKNISNLSSELSEEEKKFFEKFDKEVNLDNLTSYLDVSDWELVIAWRPFTYLRRRHDLPKVDLNSLENTIETLSKKNDIVILLSEIYDIWAKEAYNQQASLWFRRFRKSDFDVEWKEFLTSSDFRKMWDIDGLENAVKYAWITIEDIYSYDWKDFEKKFEKVFFYMMQWEKKESIIWESDMEEIKKIFFDKNLSIEQKRLKIFDLMRYWWWSWNSVWVKDHLADSILFQRGKDWEFVHKDLKNILENERINEILSDVSIDKRDSGATNKIAQNKLESFLWKEYKDCAKSIIEAYKKSLKETKRSLKHHYEEEKKENEQLKNVTFEEYLEKALNWTTIESIALNWVKYAIKHILVSYKIEKMDYRWDKKNSFTWIYANTIGLD